MLGRKEGRKELPQRPHGLSQAIQVLFKPRMVKAQGLQRPRPICEDWLCVASVGRSVVGSVGGRGRAVGRSVCVAGAVDGMLLEHGAAQLGEGLLL